MTPAVEVRGLSKSYGAICALDNVSFRVEPGQAVALLGPNGSGKTTTLRCVAGLLHPDAGQVEICGIDLRRDARQAKQQFSYLPQQADFPAQVSIREVIEFHAQLRGLKPDLAAAALRQAGISPDQEERPVGQLSGGMRHRLSLAVAGMPPVKLMLLDEPTASLDPQAAVRLRQQAARWRDEGRSLLFSTHVLDDVEELADKVVVLVEGRAVREENVARLREDLRRSALLRVDVGQATPAHQRAALDGGATQAELNATAIVIRAPVECRYQILNRLSQVGEVRHFETEQPSIEHLYLQYVEGSRSGTA